MCTLANNLSARNRFLGLLTFCVCLLYTNVLSNNAWQCLGLDCGNSRPIDDISKFVLVQGRNKKMGAVSLDKPVAILLDRSCPLRWSSYTHTHNTNIHTHIIQHVTCTNALGKYIATHTLLSLNAIKKNSTAWRKQRWTWSNARHNKPTNDKGRRT